METDDKYYEVSQTALKDKSMLGTQGQQLCDNVDAHWMIQTCTATNTTSKYMYIMQARCRNILGTSGRSSPQAAKTIKLIDVLTC